MRLRLYDLRISEFPATNGICATDVHSVAMLANRCQRRLLYCKEAGEEGWYGTWAEVEYHGISRTIPYITLPSEHARIERLNVCRQSVPLQNQFYEYLTFGNGRMPQYYQNDDWCLPQGYMRNDAITWINLPNPPQMLRIYSTSSADANTRRVLIQGVDSNDNVVRTMDGPNQVQGEYVTLEPVFADTTFSYKEITGLQKDVTAGTIQFMALDPTTGVETLIHTMEPGEKVAGYRRYYLSNLPCSCCAQNSCVTPSDVEVLAIVKLELIPVKVDQDYLLIQNLEALIEEAWSVHFSDLESASTSQKAIIHHANAVRLLNGELNHYLGVQQPAISFKPFGSARLERINIGMT